MKPHMSIKDKFKIKAEYALAGDPIEIGEYTISRGEKC
jgi:hypothetical protein